MKIITTRQNSISGIVSISDGINLAKKETNFGEWDVCDINCIYFSKIGEVDDPNILSSIEDHCAMFFPQCEVSGKLNRYFLKFLKKANKEIYEKWHLIKKITGQQSKKKDRSTSQPAGFNDIQTLVSNIVLSGSRDQALVKNSKRPPDFRFSYRHSLTRDLIALDLPNTAVLP